MIPWIGLQTAEKLGFCGGPYLTNIAAMRTNSAMPAMTAMTR